MKPLAPIETLLESVAALWAGGCTGTALWLVGPASGVASASLAAVGGLAAGAGTLRLLQRSRSTTFAMAGFEVAQIETTALEELLLTDEVIQPAAAPIEDFMLTLEQRLGTQPKTEAAAGTVLLLEDVLPPIESESRVIRLFDPAAMPKAGELQSRIDRHLQNREAPAYPDAAQALNDALADLRRSLR